MYLGLNAYSHDSSACLMDEEGNIIAAVEEERFTEIVLSKEIAKKTYFRYIPTPIRIVG